MCDEKVANLHLSVVMISMHRPVQEYKYTYIWNESLHGKIKNSNCSTSYFVHLSNNEIVNKHKQPTHQP